ncbi:acetoacetate--CoA ligase [Devosia nitrariae]|uniref:Acetoacetyl-CoA synthetase n=1 Tax=Devosia nitrariae TaxID=2071872 RepID=A0ABQ5W8Q5_9HYPH|nr:acetoacetate--CoA ligase [Devosia nitrariae]GLQ56209.1 acetoacetyl-CoA synthetase [Devosia nitrariae]
MASDIVWTPSSTWIDAANMTRFAQSVGLGEADYDTLHRWSVSHPGDFWGAVWDFAGMIGEKGEIAFEPPPEGTMLGAKWFPQARLNFVENLLRGPDETLAVIESDETGITRRITMGRLRDDVARIADGLRDVGVGPGDCVGGVLPNRLEGLVALLATASVGAVWSSCSPDFGAAAILDRLGQIAPKVLFATRRYQYGGRQHDIGERLREVVAGIPSLTRVVLTDGGIGDEIAGASRWEAFGSPSSHLRFERLPFSQPLYVLYTSGTTGKPKAIVHGAGGVLLQHLKEHQLHCDLKPGDAIGWYTNTAWMMYHWLISGLASGATIVLTDGAAIPKTDDGSDAGLLWRLAESAGLTHLGVSPKFMHAVAEAGYRPRDRVDLEKLRVLMSAGAPVAPDQYDWTYEAIKDDMMFASISGGTEIIGCFLIGSPTLPVRRGQLTCKALGQAVQVLDTRNVPVIGRKGELTCTEPFPSMPLTFWGEGGDKRYFDTYFSQRPGIWTHGDLAEETINGSGIIYGRTDTTLKPGGVRIGTSEIYATVEKFPEIADCVVFGAPNGNDEEIVLCLQPRADAGISRELAARIRKAIRETASPRHVPHRIHAVPGVPYTLNGKRVESAARAIMIGEIVKNLDSLSNPEVLDVYRVLGRETAL